MTPRPCILKDFDFPNDPTKERRATFLAFGNTSGGNTVAIVELEDGQLCCWSLGFVRFTDRDKRQTANDFIEKVRKEIEGS